MHLTKPLDIGLKVVGRTIGLVRGSAIAVTRAVSGDRSAGRAERPSAAAPEAPAAPTPPPAPEPASDDLAERLAAPDEVETPVGTPGAGTAYNPDTAETDLQQPGTEPLMDPSTTKSVASESEMLRKGAERNP